MNPTVRPHGAVRAFLVFPLDERHFDAAPEGVASGGGVLMRQENRVQLLDEACGELSFALDELEEPVKG